MKAWLVISERDNVATALEPLEPGRTIPVGDRLVTVRDAIPRGHKIALHQIHTGEAVVKYGSPIGLASVDIGPGAHVHTHNLASTRGRGDVKQAGVPDPEGLGPHRAGARLAEPPDIEESSVTAHGPQPGGLKYQ